MRISRDITLKIHYILDQLLPPIIRDNRFFSKVLFRLLFGNKKDIFMNFKNKVFYMTEEEFIDTYKQTSDVHIQRDTDLNVASEKMVLESIVGDNILEVGCGRGYLSNKLKKNGKVTATDIIISEELRSKYEEINFVEANIENLPFDDDSYDTVVCTHTLEHVQNISEAIIELRRVTKNRLIIVVPQQRPYKYTFDLHVHFFPYTHSLLSIIGNKSKEVICKEAQGDLFYYENKQEF